jgi:hypothetical protein
MAKSKSKKSSRAKKNSRAKKATQSIMVVSASNRNEARRFLAQVFRDNRPDAQERNELRRKLASSI